MKMFVRTIKKSSNLLCFKQNVNNSTCASQSVPFHRTNENQKSRIFFTNQFSFRKSLVQTPAIFNLNFRRNISINTKDPEKKPDPHNQSSAESTDLSLSENDMDLSLSNLLDNISNSNLVNLAEDVLLDVHKDIGLPWWATIAVTAFGARTAITLPLAISQVRIFLKLQAVNLELEGLKKKIKIEVNQACVKFGWPKYIVDEKYNEAVDKEMEILLVREKCHPVKTGLLIIFQIPLWLSFTFATRKLCIPSESAASQETYTELLTESFAWIENLTITDQFYVLPITIALVNLAVTQVHHINAMDKLAKKERLKTMLARGLSLSLIPVAATLPIATNIYWLSSSCYGLLQALILYSKPSRRLFKMPLHKPKKIIVQNIANGKKS